MLEKKQLEHYLSECMRSEADFAEIYEELEHSETIRALSGKVEDINQVITSGLGIRLYKDVQSVYAYTNDDSEESIMALIRDLRDTLGACEKDVSVHLERVTYENRHPAEIDFESVPMAEKTDLLKRSCDAAFEADPRIIKVQATLLNVKQEVQISNSDGKMISDTRVRTRMMTEAFASENGKMVSGGDRPGAGMGLEFFCTSTPEACGKEATRIALVNLSAKDCPSGKMPVIIDNAFGGVIFHEACGHALEATSVSKNASVFCGKLGQKIAADCVSAVDDGTIPNAWGSQNIDDEGNFQKRRVLIENGVLKSYLIDTLNGRRMGMESTSSSRRQSYQFEPTSRMTNTFILPGNSSFEELFEGVERGLYAKKMGGGSVNPQTGEFNFAVNEGYLIENGKIAYPVRGASLIGNGAEILRNIDRVCSNLERGQGMCGSLSGSIPTDVGQPAIRVTSITVGGTSNE
ncbi:MAG: TldD/PmbA family protein [Erysipelotrichaceae bacterium]|nr:TldD/PmbA family protein [Erysipelotrichaceae bacterium]